MRYDPELHGDYLEIDEAAWRMKLTANQVRELVFRRVLRSLDLGAGLVLVQPAITNYKLTSPP